MAHFAKLDKNNLVIDCVVVNNNAIDKDDEEKSGIELLNSIYSEKFNWIQTSYNAGINGFRFNYAGIGYTYDPIDDAFIAPMWECGHPELTLNKLKRWDCTNAEHIIKEPTE
tara:strand:+ start:283 stop:618 length:336 start_codon:yes stop_codon:yes gene_type:complete